MRHREPKQTKQKDIKTPVVESVDIKNGNLFILTREQLLDVVKRTINESKKLNELAIETEKSFLDKTDELGRTMQHDMGLANIIKKYNDLYAFEAPLPDPSYAFGACLDMSKKITVVCKHNDSAVEYQLDFKQDGTKRLCVKDSDYEIPDGYYLCIGFYVENLKSAQRVKFENLMAVAKKLNGIGE